MRISTSWTQHVSLTSMLDQQSQLSKTQKQLSSGLKNTLPSDDPIAASKALAFKSIIEQTNQYQRNIETARERNRLEESALESAQDVIFRAKDLSIQAANGTMTDNDRIAIKAEVDQLLGHMVSVANTQNANGEYIFSGYLSKTKPFDLDVAGAYEYLGTEDQRTIQISEERRVADGGTGFDIFENINSAAGGQRSIFNTLESLSTALANNEPDINEEMSDLESTLESLNRARSAVGSRLRTLDDQEAQHEKFLLDFKTTLSEIEDLDYAEAISRFNQQDMALQAAQQSFSKIQKLTLFNYL
ncbi:MAG: flagellar hook-associated protein FlgL [Methylococcales bacterium]|nr:flagellar hook-associated protein FlgL [Methylococcales bacterium]